MMHRIAALCVLCVIVTSSQSENVPIDYETDEIAVNALYEVSRRLNDDLELVKVNSMQKETSYSSPMSNRLKKRVKLDIEARKKSDGVILACGVLLFEHADGVMQFADYPVCEPVAAVVEDVSPDVNCTRNEKKKFSLNIEKLMNNNIDQENSLLELSGLDQVMGEQHVSLRKVLACTKLQEIDGSRYTVVAKVKQGNTMQLCSVVADKSNDETNFVIVERICEQLNEN